MIDSSVEAVKSIHHELYTMEYKSNGILYGSISGFRPETIEDTIQLIDNTYAIIRVYASVNNS